MAMISNAATGGLLAFVFILAAAPASASCGGFPFTHGPGLGQTTSTGKALIAGDVVTVNFTNSGVGQLRVFKSAPAPDVDIVPLTGATSGSGTFVAPATASYAFSASRNANDGFFATVNYTCAAAPAPVPTLSEWAMILLGVMLAGGAAMVIDRRRAIRPA